ncbi:MAG: ABC transporter ATP-binding protein [Jatrophihabitantaceae bacterium]
MGIEVTVEGLTKSFGKQVIWGDVTLALPPGEISVMLGPSGTGKSVFLKTLVGLLKPDRGSIFIRDVNLARCSEHQLYETRKLFGVLFQDGALFGSMNLFDNIAFPLREHTRKSESEIKRIVTEKLEMVGLEGTEKKLPGEISGGMRKRAGLARALVLNPEIILFDEPDSGLDPVRVAYLNQLIVDLNAQTDSTFLIVTHDIGTARTVPDNLGLLFRRELVMFGPREVLLTSQEPVVKQFLNGRREGPIGMSEEKDAGQVAAELASISEDEVPAPGTGPKGATGGGVPPQLQPSPGLPERRAAARRQQRVLELLHTLPAPAQAVIRQSLSPDAAQHNDIGRHNGQQRLDGAGRDGGAQPPTPMEEPAAQPVGADRTAESRGPRA